MKKTIFLLLMCPLLWPSSIWGQENPYKYHYTYTLEVAGNSNTTRGTNGEVIGDYRVQVKLTQSVDGVNGNGENRYRIDYEISPLEEIELLGYEYDYEFYDNAELVRLGCMNHKKGNPAYGPFRTKIEVSLPGKTNAYAPSVIGSIGYKYVPMKGTMEKSMVQPFEDLSSFGKLSISTLKLSFPYTEGAIKKKLNLDDAIQSADDLFDSNKLEEARAKYAEIKSRYKKYLSSAQVAQIDARIESIDDLLHTDTGSNTTAAKKSGSSAKSGKLTITSSTSETKADDEKMDYYEGRRNTQRIEEEKRQEAIDDLAYATVMTFNMLGDAATGARLYLNGSYGNFYIDNSEPNRLNNPANYGSRIRDSLPDNAIGLNRSLLTVGSRVYWGPVYWATEFGIGMNKFAGWIYYDEFEYEGQSAPAFSQTSLFEEFEENDLFSTFIDRQDDWTSADDITRYTLYKYSKAQKAYNLNLRTGLGLSVPIGDAVSIDVEALVGVGFDVPWLNTYLTESEISWTLPEYRVFLNIGKLGIGISRASLLDPYYLLENDARLGAEDYAGNRYHLFRHFTFRNADKDRDEVWSDFSSLWSVNLIWAFDTSD